MLKRVRIVGYKSLHDVEVHLEPLSVLFGPNAAGKSNFLDALQLLSRMATSRTLKEAFEPPYRGKPLESFSFPEDGIKGLRRQDRAAFSIEADLELSPAVVEVVDRQIREMRRTGPSDDPDAAAPSKVREKLLRYRVEIEILPKSGFLRVADESLTALNKHGEIKKSRKPFLERMGKRLHLRMEKQAHPTYYDRYLDHTVLSMPLYPPHYPHLVAARQELASWLLFYFEPRERMRVSNPVKEVRHIGLMGEDLASFLNTLKISDEKQFRAVEKSLRLIVPAVHGIQLDVNDLGEVELRLLEGKMVVPARVISEGTLRTLGLLALSGARESPSLVCFEEPENGIHPRRIRMIAELLNTRAQTGDTQVLVTTHSPILPDYTPQSALFVCRKENGKTSIETLDSAGPLYRRSDIAKGVDGELPRISARILRGDFDA